MNDASSSYYSGNYEKGLFYEGDFLEYIRCLNITGHYVDIGTNIANHLVFLGMFTDAKRIYGFEPIDAYRAIAIENVKNNQLDDKVVVYPDALSDGRGSTTISIDGRSQHVTLAPLDSHEVAKNEISLVKIDVEGMEPLVLMGAKETINKNRPILFIEVIQHEGSREYLFSDIEALMGELEYVPTGRAFNFQPTLEFIPSERMDIYNEFSKQYYVSVEELKASHDKAFITRAAEDETKLQTPGSNASWFSKDISDFAKCEGDGDYLLNGATAAFLEIEAYPEEGTKFYVVVNAYRDGEVSAQTKKYVNRRCFSPINGVENSDKLRVFIYVENGAVLLKKLAFTVFG